MKLWWLSMTLLLSCEGCSSVAPVPPPPPGQGAAAPGESSPAERPPGQQPSPGAQQPGPGSSAPGVERPPTGDEQPAAGDLPALAPPEPLVSRGEMAELERPRCHRILRRAGIPFRAVPPEGAPDVEMPILLSGPMEGIEVRYRGRRERNSIMDCRLAVALAGWVPTLRSIGVERIEHMSIYRPGSRVRTTGRRSGHANGSAIDVSHLVRGAQGTLEVERDWSDKARGAEPCAPREAEPEPQRLLRALVCIAVEADLFQVVVTPHGDARHHNHVHLEIRPEVSWSHVR